MKTKKLYLFSLLCVLSLLMAACVTSIPSPRVEEDETTSITVTEAPEPTENVVTEEPEPTKSVVTEEPEPAESVVTEEPEPTESVTIEEPETTEEVVEELTAFTSPLIGEIVSDFTLSDGEGNMVSLSSLLQENEQVVLVFYYGYGCVPCMAQLTEIENYLAEYEQKGAQVIASAVQKESGARRSVEISGAQYPILADEDHEVAKAFGVYEGGSFSTPSVFIINQDREIVWGEISHIDGGYGGCGTNRITNQTILENLPILGETVSSLNPVTTPDGDLVGESELERDTNKIVLNFEACCVTPGNAYTA
jgi:peroxiredoxin